MQQVAARFLFSTTSSAMKTTASPSDFLDLSASLPFSASVPEFLPSAMELSACGFSRRIRDARIAVRSVADHSAIALGVDQAGHQIGVLRSDLQRHMLILGSSGVGKSTLMRRMIAQDLRAGVPVIMVDPHGDLFADVAAEVEAKGFQEAITAAFPETTVQTCIVHLIWHSMNFCSWKDRKAKSSGKQSRKLFSDPPHTADLRPIYEAPTAKEAACQSDAFEEK